MSQRNYDYEIKGFVCPFIERCPDKRRLDKNPEDSDLTD